MRERLHLFYFNRYSGVLPFIQNKKGITVTFLKFWIQRVETLNIDL